MFARPCSIVVDVKELFGAESKSQVYAHVHNFLKKIKGTSKYIFCSYEYYYNSINKVLNVFRPFPSSRKSQFQNESKCEIFVVKISFICIIIKTHFHTKVSHLASF